MEIQRLQQEVRALQADKRGLQQQQREAALQTRRQAQQHEETLLLLQAKADRLARNESRESQNLEYLKNVLVHLLSCRDEAARRGLLKAVVAVLRLTPQEEARVRGGSGC